MGSKSVEIINISRDKTYILLTDGFTVSNNLGDIVQYNNKLLEVLESNGLPNIVIIPQKLVVGGTEEHKCDVSNSTDNSLEKIQRDFVKDVEESVKNDLTIKNSNYDFMQGVGFVINIIKNKVVPCHIENPDDFPPTQSD